MGLELCHLIFTTIVREGIYSEVCDDRFTLDETPHEDDWLAMSVVVWKIMRGMPRPLLLVVVFFLLVATARA